MFLWWNVLTITIVKFLWMSPRLMTSPGVSIYTRVKHVRRKWPDEERTRSKRRVLKTSKYSLEQEKCVRAFTSLFDTLHWAQHPKKVMCVFFTIFKISQTWHKKFLLCLGRYSGHTTSITLLRRFRTCEKPSRVSVTGSWTRVVMATAETTALPDFGLNSLLYTGRLMS